MTDARGRPLPGLGPRTSGCSRRPRRPRWSPSCGWRSRGRRARSPVLPGERPVSTAVRRAASSSSSSRRTSRARRLRGLLRAIGQAKDAPRAAHAARPRGRAHVRLAPAAPPRLHARPRRRAPHASTSRSCSAGQGRCRLRTRHRSSPPRPRGGARRGDAGAGPARARAGPSRSVPGTKTLLLFGYGLGRLAGGTVVAGLRTTTTPAPALDGRAPRSSAWTSPRPSGTRSRSGLQQVAETRGPVLQGVRERRRRPLPGGRRPRRPLRPRLRAPRRPARRAPGAPRPRRAPRHRAHPHTLCGLTPRPSETPCRARLAYSPPSWPWRSARRPPRLGPVPRRTRLVARDGPRRPRLGPGRRRLRGLPARLLRPRGTWPASTARLDHVRDLGATVVWLMPIHPIGREKRKGTYGSPYSIRDFTP